MSAFFSARIGVLWSVLTVTTALAEDAGVKSQVGVGLSTPAVAIAQQPVEVTTWSNPSGLTTQPVLMITRGNVTRPWPIAWGTSMTLLLQGDNTLVLQYPGDATHAASESPPATVRVDPPLTASPAPVVVSEYDPLGNLTKEVRSVDGGVFVTARYDALSQPSMVIDALKGVTQFGFDGLGRTLYVADPRTLITEYPHDGLGNTQLRSPDTGLNVRTHDAAGNLKTLTDARGALTTNTYDASNRLLSTTSQLGAEVRATTFRYDEAQTNSFNAGRLSSAQTADVAAVYAYDERGNVLSETRTLKPAVGANASPVMLRVGYTYEPGGQLTSMRYPSGNIIAYSNFWGAPRVLIASGSKGRRMVLMSAIQFEPFGGMRSWSWPAVTGQPPRIRSFDLAGRMTRYSLGPLLRDLKYDDAGRIIGYRHFVAATGVAAPEWDQSFTSDTLGRLTNFTAQQATTQYTYDSNGNRLSETAGGLTRRYTIDPSSNRVQTLSNPAESYSYDLVGNLTGTSRFAATYDAANRLKTVTVNGVTSTYTYDEGGRRVRKVNSTGPTSTILFVYDTDSHLLGEYGPTGATLREYVWVGDVPVAMLVPDAVNAWGFEAYFIQADHLNAPRVLVDRQGRVRWRWLSDPFGTTPANEDPIGAGALEMPLRFPGQYADKETGLVFNHARDYDPRLGRYIESDPSGLEGGPNTYAFVFNDPLRFTDPTGLMGNGAGGTGESRLSRQVSPLNPTLYYGAEAHLLIGGGLAAVSCVDKCGVRHIFRYYKLCGGAAVGASFGGGALRNMTGETCKPETYEGWFAEFGVSTPGYGGVELGFGYKKDGRPTLAGWPNLPGTRSYVDQLSGGLSLGVKAKGSICYYKSL